MARRREPTELEQLEFIRQWFERHKRDYCEHGDGPPKAWSEYFKWLLDTATEHATAPAGMRER